MIEADQHDQGSRRTDDHGVRGVKRGDRVRADPEHQTHRCGEDQTDADPVQGVATCLVGLSRPDRLAGQDRRRIAQRQRHHERQHGKIGRNLMGRRSGGSQTGDEQRHEGEGRYIRKKGEANREAQSEKGRDGFPIRGGYAVFELVSRVFALPQTPNPGQQGDQPGVDAGGHRAAGTPQCWCAHEPVHEYRVERYLEQQGEQVEDHHRAWSADAGRHADEDAKGEGAGMDFVSNPPSLVGAMMRGHDRGEGEQNPRHSHHDGDLDRCGNPDRGQVEGGKLPRHNRVDDTIANDGQLGNQHRPSQVQQFPRGRQRGSHGVGSGWSIDRLVRTRSSRARGRGASQGLS